ncbi:cytochrome c peroxidase [Fulvivirgaceae bacterium BMA10]|uniref:Cytochrome c peroxidase n=1 Tax=Splendidivirga corallicola TaxID=3051826 RepID=A0ABT8KUN7_9BACT|nr:cytochrome c peroxidase [Fulvivirgaceae bacterium BMA10]
MKINRLAFVTAIVSAAFFYSCVNDDDGPGQTDLDQQLQDVLNTSGGVNSFKFPSSTDLANIPQDPLNPLTPEKVALGQLLFHETGIAVSPKEQMGTGTYSCASCHHAEAGFQAGRAQGIGEGGSGFGTKGQGRTLRVGYDADSLDVQPIRTPSALNIAYQKNILWNGQFGATGVNVGTEALWTPGTPKEVNTLGFEGTEIQAIAGLGVHRMDVVGSLCESNADYKQMFEDAFPNISESERITKQYAGLAIGAYERTLLATEAPFQKWLNGDKTAMSDSEKRGALVFFGKGNCNSCHSGPALNSMNFYALGMSDLRTLPNVFQMADADHKGRADFTGASEDEYKFKVPQLYNLKDSPFLGHGSSFNSVREVVEYKNSAVPENAVVPTSQLATEFTALNLTDEEIADLTNFIETALYDANLTRYVPSSLPSGNCFPNNDPQSQIDLGCN